MAIIKLKTEGQELKPDGIFPVITSGNKKIDSVKITLDDLWLDESEGVISYYFVIWLDEAEAQEKLMTKDGKEISADIPNEFLIIPQTISFGIYAKNANGETLITSSIINFKIEKGTPTNNEPVIDWQAFKADLIDLLNENFAAGLTESATVEEITAALDAAEINESARAELIAAVNGSLRAGLDTDATIEEIIAFINNYSAVSAAVLFADWHILATGGYSNAV